MKYFIPDWDDLVDPNYNFITDEHAPNREPLTDDVYAHQIFGNRLSYDGILVSKAQIDKSKKKKALTDLVGIHGSLRIPKTTPVLGDSGAFDYIAQDKPPYKTEELIAHYENLGFDYGVSLDHLIIPAFYHQKYERVKITIDNAREMIELYKAGNYHFTPIGAIQGWDPDSYVECAKEIIAMGYNYIALGGMVKSQTKDILAVLRKLKPFLPKGIDLHLFGIARLDAVKEFSELGVTSIDSASPLRQAWTDATKNYHVNTDKINAYTAIRIPSFDGGEFAKGVKQGIINEQEIIKLEQNCLNLLRQYDKSNIEVEETIDAVIRYSGLKNAVEFINNLNHFKNDYLKLSNLLEEINQSQAKELLDGYFSILNLPDFSVYDDNQWKDWLHDYIVVDNKLIEKQLLEAINKIEVTDKTKLVKELTAKLVKEKGKLLQIANYLEKDIPKLRNKLSSLLEDKPWKECDCKICQEVGIEVVIFRGNNRNRRRGFHNTLRFYEKLKIILNPVKCEH